MKTKGYVSEEEVESFPGSGKKKNDNRGDYSPARQRFILVLGICDAYNMTKVTRSSLFLVIFMITVAKIVQSL